MLRIHGWKLALIRWVLSEYFDSKRSVCSTVLAVFFSVLPDDTGTEVEDVGRLQAHAQARGPAHLTCTASPAHAASRLIFLAHRIRGLSSRPSRSPARVHNTKQQQALHRKQARGSCSTGIKQTDRWALGVWSAREQCEQGSSFVYLELLLSCYRA